MLISVCSWASKFGWWCNLIFYVTRSRLSQTPTTCWRLSRWGLAFGVCSCISHMSLMPEHIIHSRTPYAHPKDSPGIVEPQRKPADIRTGYPRNTSLHSNHFIIRLAQPVRRVKTMASFQEPTTVILSFISVWNTRRQVLPTATLTFIPADLTKINQNTAHLQSTGSRSTDICINNSNYHHHHYPSRVRPWQTRYSLV